MSTPHPRHVERIRKMKQRLAVRAWEYRQRNTSKGVWNRLRILLALSEKAFAIDEAAANALIARGFVPHPVGKELEPSREYFVLNSEQIEETAILGGAPEIPVRLDPAFLAEPRVALVRFPGL